MKMELTTIEARVLGCLVEKELATPEYYPLSLNALTNACNQKSNRDPVMSLDEPEVAQALDSLRFKGLAMQSAEGSRVSKYRHALAEKLYLEPYELAIVAELLLRGPQTVGELRTRTERMYSFGDLAAVETVLSDLMERETPLVARLPRQSGRKESRFAHLFCGEPTAEMESETMPSETRGTLAQEVATLREELETLRREFEEFRRSLE
jgi:uncharacterized protein